MRAVRYVCPECGNAVTLHVNPSRQPTCMNPHAHSSRRVEMQAARHGEKGKPVTGRN